MLSAPSVFILVLVTVDPNAVVLSSRIGIASDISKSIARVETAKTRSAVSAFELVTLDSTSNCLPGGETECKYKAVNAPTRIFQGRQHKKVGYSEFADALVVNTLQDGTSQVEADKEYVWKRFLLNDADKERKELATVAFANAKISYEKIKALNCPHTLAPLDMNPEVVVQGKLHERNFKDNGFIFEKMDGSAFDWWDPADKVRRNKRVSDCAVSFWQEMMAALTCIRQAGLVHTDVKLDSILYKEQPGEQCPSWYLTDFDLLTTVGEYAHFFTPPLQEINERINVDGSPIYENGMTLTGAEDFYSFAVYYTEILRREYMSRTEQGGNFREDMCRFITYMRKNPFGAGKAPLSIPGLGPSQDDLLAHCLASNFKVGKQGKQIWITTRPGDYSGIE